MLNIPIPIEDKRYYGRYINNITLLTYKDYQNETAKIINREDINECDLIAKFTSQSHNTMENEIRKLVNKNL